MIRILLILTTFMGFWSISVPAVFAQDEADSTSPAASPEDSSVNSSAVSDGTAKGDGTAPSDESMETVDSATDDSGFMSRFSEMLHSGAMGLMLKGGLFMWPILLMGIAAFGVMIERYRSLKMLATDTQALRSQVRSFLEQDQVEEALELCENQPGPVPAILSAGLRKYVVLRRLGYDAARIEEQVVKAMDDYGIHVVAALEKHLPSLATVASVAPMLGFLGTVSGMVNSFDTIVAQMGETNIVEAAAGGISEALLTTAFGLIVGIPAYVTFNYFTSVINRFVLEVEESATELIETVTLQMALRQRESTEA